MKAVRRHVVEKFAVKYQVTIWQKAVHAKKKPPKRDSTDTECQAAIEEDWELIDLSDVQPVHLAKMDLTCLSPSLLELAERGSLEYTEEEKEALQELFTNGVY